MSTNDQYGINTVYCLSLCVTPIKAPNSMSTPDFQFSTKLSLHCHWWEKAKITRIVQLSKNILAPASRQNYTPPTWTLHSSLTVQNCCIKYNFTLVQELWKLSEKETCWSTYKALIISVINTPERESGGGGQLLNSQRQLWVHQNLSCHQGAANHHKHH